MAPRPTRRPLAILLTGLLAGCSSQSSHIRDLPAELPTDTSYAYDAANRCLARHVDHYLITTHKRVLLFVDYLGDKRTNPVDFNSHELANSGREVFQDLTARYIQSPRVQQTFTTPTAVRGFFDYGAPIPDTDRRYFAKTLDADLFVGISGGWIGFDQNITHDANAAGARVSPGNMDFRLEGGRTQEGERVRLVLKLGFFFPNRLFGTVNVAGVRRRDAKSIKISIGWARGDVGYTSEQTVADGLNSVQEAVMAAAWFKIWTMMLPDPTAAAQCLVDPSSSPLTVLAAADDWEHANLTQRVRMLQQALNEYGGTPLVVSGVLDGPTLTKIRNVELQMKLLPHTLDKRGNNLGHFYQVVKQGLAARGRS